MNPSASRRSRVFILCAAILLAFEALAGRALVAAAPQAGEGSIAVEVTDAALVPLADVNVQILDASGNSVANQPTDASGGVTFSGLAAGTYYARTFNSLGFVDEVYDNVFALSGNWAEGTPITVSDQGTETIAFRLDQGGRIAGQITDVATAQGIANVWVDISDDAGRHVASTDWTDASGNYITQFGLPAGNYHVTTNNNESWVNELYDGRQSWSRVIDGTPVAVVAGETTGGIDFALEEGARIAGTVTGPGGVPISGAWVNVMDGSGRGRTGSVSGPDGTYTTGVVPAGSYFVASGAGAHVSEIYDNVTCLGCGITGGAPVSVTAGSTTTGIDFQLAVGGQIAGRITDAVTTNGVSGIWVDVFDSTGRHVGSTPQSDADGFFATAFGLPTGTYYAHTNSSAAYVNEAYNDLPQTATMSERTPIEVTAGSTASGIDFALAPGGRISGRITDAGTGHPVAWWGGVSVFDGNGVQVAGAGVDGAGRYTTAGLPAGDYYVVANSSAGHIAQIHDGVTCLNCGIAGGTPVAVTVGATTSGIDFALTRGGAIAGTITDSGTTNGIASAWVNVFDSAGRHIGGSPWTDASGAYKIQFGLPAGSYYVATGNAVAYIDEVHDDVPCLSCSVVSGTLVAVSLGATTDVDFALDPGGRISGRVTNADGGAGISGAWVDIHDSTGRHLGSSPPSDAGGYYTTQFGLPTGTYNATTNNNGAFVNEAYDNLPGNTAASNRTPIAVTAGATTAGIDFQLSEGGRIAGRVVTAGTLTPIQNIGISIFDSSGVQVASTNTDSAGRYLSAGMPTGTYYAKTNRFGAYIQTLYAGAVCLHCDVRTGTPIGVTAGATTGDIDFALVVGGQIAGHVTDAASTLPVANVSVEVADATGAFIWGWEQPTDATGAYTTTGLPSGTYYIRTNGSHSYVNEFYDNLPFISNVTSTTPVAVVLGAVTSNIDFALATGGRISGQVVDAHTLSPLSGVGVSFFDASGNGVGGVGTDGSGHYLSPGLVAGTYYAKTERFGAYIQQLHGGIPFLQGDVTTGTPIAVAAGGTTTGVDFALGVGGQIAGHVTNAAGGAPLGNVNVEVADATGRFIWGWEQPTDATGAYITTGLPAGTYYIRTNGSHGFVNEFYDNQPYGAYPPSTTPVVVTLGNVVQNIDFQLDAGGFISGVVTAEGGGLVAGAGVSFYDSSGQYAGGTGASWSGAYLSPALAAGSYYVVTNNGAGYVNELYDGIPCVNCSVTAGAQVPVTVGATTSGISFALAAGGRVSGRVTNADGGAGIPGVWVDIKDGAGNYVGSSPRTDAGGYYTTQFGLPTGTYYASTNNDGAFVNEAYDNLPTSTAFSNWTPVVLVAGATTPNIDFQLSEGGRIGGRVVDAGTLLPLANVGVSFFDTSGQGVGGASTDSSGNYLSPGLPAGTYYARTQQYGAHIQTLYETTPCVNCDVRTGTPISVGVGATTGGVDFALVKGGQIAGHIVDGAGTPLAGVPVQLVDAGGNWVGGWQSPSDATGAYTTYGLPAGTYYIRTDGVHMYVNEFYDNLPAGTNPTSATPVAVTLGNVTPNIDFQLIAGGRISGTVANQQGQPLGGVGITFSDTSGQWAGYAQTDASGSYTSPALAPGSYHLRTERYGAYIQTIYPDVFYLYGSVTQGTAVPVTVGNTTSGIDFTLVRGGQISGHVTAGGSGTPLANVNTEISDASGRTLAGWENPATDSAGFYISRGLPAGTYYIRTNGSHGHVNEYYDNLPFSSNTTSTTPVVVSLGTVTPNIDFQLAPGGVIAGTLTNQEGSPVGGVSMSFYNASNQWVGGAQTNASGVYASPAFLAGSYYVEARGPAPYIAMVYPSTFCLNCNRTTGTPVPVTVGNTTGGINMTLVRGGQIGGTITDALTTQPVAGVAVSLRDSTGNSLFYGWEPNSGPAGTYLTRGLPTGTYYIRTEGAHSYVNEYYDNLPVWTSWSSSTPVLVTLGSVTGNINFALSPGGRISGRVTSAATGLGIGSVWVYVYDASNHLLGTPQTSSSGDYVTPSLPAGSYYLQIVNAPGYIPEVYDNITCIGCSAATGTPVTVTVGATTTGIDFSLELSGRVSGTITDAGTGLGIANVRVELLNASGVKVGESGNTNAAGQYSYTSPLLTGTYYARTQNSAGYTNEVYDGLPIWTATVAGTPITVTGGSTTTVNFALGVNSGQNTAGTAVEVPLGLTENLVFTNGSAPDTVWYKFLVPPGDAGKDLKVNLRVTSPYPNPIPSGWGSDLDFELLDGAVKVRALAVSSSDNETLYLHDVAPGWYYIYMGYSSTNYADTNLAARYSVSVETGTGFGVGYISGRVLDSNGQGVEQAWVRAHAVPGNWAVSFPTVTAGPGGNFAVAVPPGYRALWFTGDGTMSPHQAAINVVEEFYSDRVSQQAADTLIVTEGATTSVGDVTLAIGAIVSGHVTNASGSPLANVSVVPITPDGWAKTGVRTDATGAYTLPGVPPGGALVRFSRSNFAQEFYADRPTIGTATVLATQGGGFISNVDAVLTAGGAVTGTVQNTSGAPVSANVRLYSVLDSTFARASANSSVSTGAFTFNNVKPGQYKIQFSFASVGFGERWYNDAASFADAAVVTVTEGGTVSGITAQLVPVASEMNVTWGVTPIASGGMHDFGSHLVNADADEVFTIANTGNGGLTVTGLPLVVSGPDAYQFSVVAQPVFPVLPGANTSFTVRFRPTSAGSKSAYISIGNNDSNENPYVVNLTGTGITSVPTRIIGLSGDLAFGNVKVGTTATRTLTIANTGNSVLTVTGIAYPPGFSGAWSGTVPAGGAQDVTVTFAPTAVAAYGGSITVSGDQTAGTDTIAAWGAGLPGRVARDFDGDAKADVAVYRPASGTWFWLESSTANQQYKYQGWGVKSQGDVPVAGDFDGDGKVDPTVYRPATGTWFILESHAAFATWKWFGWGAATDLLLPGDYDGDGTTDAAVYRASTGTWFVRPSGAGAPWSVVFGQPGDEPLAGDFDGDGMRDPAVYRPSTGTWFWLKSSSNLTEYEYRGWGVQPLGDVPAPGDYDGDGTTDLCVFRPGTGTWFVLESHTGGTTWNWFGWGTSTDTLVPADYDGDGRTDAAVYRPSTGTWYVRPASGASQWNVVFGQGADVPLQGRR